MNGRKGFRFTSYQAPERTPFEKLFDIFQELITHTSGDVEEALDWLRELDKEYELTDEDYTIDDFIEDLKAKGYLREEIELGPGRYEAVVETDGSHSYEGWEGAAPWDPELWGLVIHRASR